MHKHILLCKCLFTNLLAIGKGGGTSEKESPAYLYSRMFGVYLKNEIILNN